MWLQVRLQMWLQVWLQMWLQMPQPRRPESKACVGGAAHHEGALPKPTRRDEVAQRHVPAKCKGGGVRGASRQPPS